MQTLPEIEIRLFTMNDLRTLRALRLEALKNDPQAFGSNYEREAGRTDEEWIERYKKTEGGNPSSVFVMAMHGGWAVGMAGAYHREDGHWDVVAVYVTPEFRGQGISRKVIERVIQDVNATGNAKPIEVTVNVNQKAAVGLYQTLGFEIVETLKDQRLGGGKTYDEYRMQRKLAKT